MRIDKNNYEAFLLDLSEGNLTDELKSELYLFLQENPELDTDVLDEIVELKAPDEEKIDKEFLNFEKINSSKRKHFFIAYHEGDLNEVDKQQVLNFISDQRKYQQEFNQFSKSKLTPSTIVFEDKKELHSIANGSEVKGVFYWSVRIAAILLIGFFVSSLLTNLNPVSPKYFVSTKNTNLTPNIEHGNDFEISKSIKKPAKQLIVENNSDSNNLNRSSKEKVQSKNEDKKQSPNVEPNEKKQFKKAVPKLLVKNPELSEIVAELDNKETKTEKESKDSVPNSIAKAPPSLLAYLEDKGKEKKLLNDNGSPDVIALINKGSKSLTGQEIVAQTSTKETSRTIFEIGGLKIERSKSK
ncbi:MAG: hypothetical protein ACQERC_03375 [Bacteroidota bacterium]